MLAVAAALAPELAAQETTVLPARDAVLRDIPALVYRIGARDGRSWETLGRIADVAFDTLDNAYVLDSQAARVFVFDARGRFLREFGVSGNGPGEFRAPTDLEITSEGYVAVLDPPDHAVTLFQPDGRFVRMVTFVNGSSEHTIRIMADPRGGLIGQTQRSLNLLDSLPSSRKSALNHFAVAGSFSDQRDVVPGAGQVALRYELPLPQPSIEASGNSRTDRYVTALDMPPVFSAAPSWGVLPDGSIAVHHGDLYAIEIIDPNGSHVRTVTRPLEPRRVTPEDIEAEGRRMRTGRSGALRVGRMSGIGAGGRIVQGPGGVRALTRSGAPVPTPGIVYAEFMSVVTGISTDLGGRIWVQRRAGDGTNLGPIDLIRADGAYIGTLPANQHVPKAVSASGLAAYVEFDDMDVPYLVVRRLPARWR